jgi:hypothetical protein
LDVHGEVWIEANTILDNVATAQPCSGNQCNQDMQGGGVYIGSQATVTLTNNVIAGNAYADRRRTGYSRGGGALYVGGTPTYTQAILRHNTLADNLTPAILNDGATITMSHTILVGHEVDVQSLVRGGLYPLTTLDYTLWWPAQGRMPGTAA